jgi:DNA adenine methylase
VAADRVWYNVFDKSAAEMNQPISYYGGKQNMVDILLSRMPEHKTYLEPFAGGASLFWNKAPGKIEVLNDINMNLVTFYEQIQNNFAELEKMVRSTLHCEASYKYAKKIYRSTRGYSRVQRAWAVWVGANMSFGSSMFDGTFKFNTNSHDSSHIGIVLNNKRQYFTADFAKRLERVIILNKDAVNVVKRFSAPDTFIYLDLPYHNAHQGHYRGYKEQDFVDLMDALVVTKSKFLLSSYNSDVLQEYVKANGWTCESFNMNLTSQGNKGGKRRKTEVITYNYNTF